MHRTGRFSTTLTIAVAACVASVCVSLAGCAPRTNAASPGTIADYTSAVGIAPELVFTTELDGYELAAQSVGPGAADGMTATWFNGGTGAMVTIRSDFGDVTQESCEAMPMMDAPDAAVACADEDGIWHRTGGGAHEYIAVREGAMIWVTGIDASSDDLLTAAENVRVPSDAELEQLFSEAPDAPGQPVERGDLPENGDGAPVDPIGPGG